MKESMNHSTGWTRAISIVMLALCCPLTAAAKSCKAAEIQICDAPIFGKYVFSSMRRAWWPWISLTVKDK